MKKIFEIAAAITLATGCKYDPARAPVDDAGCSCVDTDAACAITDGPLSDAIIDVPPDAFACSTHSQCIQMTPGTCCEDPGPASHCIPGTIIATVCVPQ